jgi:CrcB protein
VRREIAAVAVGGLLGTALRLTLDTLVPHGDDGFPVSTLLINIAGSFALGYLVARLWPVAPAWLRAGLGTGLVGSFTTFSALAVSLVSLVQADAAAIAAAYLAITLVAGFAAAWAGLRLGQAPRPTSIGADE